MPEPTSERRRLVAVLAVLAAPLLACGGSKPPAPVSVDGRIGAAASAPQGLVLCRGEGCTLTPPGGEPTPLTNVHGAVDAALVAGDTVLLLQGDRYRTLTLPSGDVSDDAPLADLGLPAGWTSVDAAGRYGDSGYVFFRGTEWATHDPASGQTAGPYPLSAWPGGWAASLPDGPDAALAAAPGELHLARGEAVEIFEIAAGRFRASDPGPKDTPDTLTPPDDPPDTVSPDEPEQDEVQWLDLRGDDAVSAFAADPDGALGEGAEGAISVWLRADWSDADCERQARTSDQPADIARKYVYDHGTRNGARFRFAITCDRRRVWIENEGDAIDWDEVRLPGDGLRDGVAHQLGLVTEDGRTAVWLDGTYVNSVEVAYRPYRASLSVGSLSTTAMRFAGRVGALRVYSRAIAGSRLAALGALHDDALRRQPEADALVARLTNEEGASTPPALVIEAPAWDPAAVAAGRPWILVSDVSRSQERAAQGSETDLNYVPQPLYTTWWADICDAPRGTSRGDLTCGTWVLLLAKTSYREEDDPHQRSLPAELKRKVYVQDVTYQAFTRRDAKSFAPVGGSEVLAWEEPPPRVEGGEERVLMTLGERHLMLALAPQNSEEGKYGGAWVGAGPINANLASHGYHIARLDPFDLTKPGQGVGMVFGMDYETVRDFRPYAWKKVPGDYTLPYGLQIDGTNIGCNGSRSVDSVSSSYELAKAAGTSFGMTIMNFRYNNTVASESRDRKSSHQRETRGEARCIDFTLIVDPPRAVLSHGLRQAVDDARDRCPAGREGDEACQAALAVIVDRYGTHYPNALAYGGIAQMLAVYTEEEARAIATWEDQTGYGFEQTIQTSGTVSGGIKGVAEVSATVGTSWTNGFESSSHNKTQTERLTSTIAEKTKWVSRGGRAGANFETWQQDPTAAIPIYADLRPLPELLAPPYFTDARVIDVVRPALDAFIREKVSVVAYLNQESFVTAMPFHHPKIEYGVDYPGNDLEPAKTAKTAPLCLDRCKRRSDCYIMAWSTTDQRCWLKRGVLNPRRVDNRQRNSAVVRKKEAPTAPPVVEDRCGVLGGDNACEKPCPKQIHYWGNDYVTLIGRVPETPPGGEFMFNDVCKYTYDFPRCYRVCLDDVKFVCEKTKSGGRWTQYGEIGRDANCYNSGNTNQPGLSVEIKD